MRSMHVAKKVVFSSIWFVKCQLADNNEIFMAATANGASLAEYSVDEQVN